MPLVCPHKDCQCRHFGHHQEVDKPVEDTEHGGGCAPLSLFAVQANVPGVSPGSDWGADLLAGKRLGRDVVLAGADLWGNLSGLGSPGRVYEQDECL
jgi:hypothetical protein